jgi:hypothetical protein
MSCRSLEPHELLSPKAHLCAYGYTILKNALGTTFLSNYASD